MTSRWRWDAYDLVTGVLRGALPVSAWTHTDRLNSAGEFTATFATDYDKIARDAISATLAGRAVIVAKRDGIPVFSGIVWRPDYPDVAGAGLFSYLDAQTLDETMLFTARDQHYMVADLVNWVQAHDGNIGIDTVTGVPASTFLRDQTWYAWEEKNIGEAIAQKADIINGFDFDVRTEVDGVRRLRLWTPRRGLVYTEQQSPVFTIAGTRSNLLELPRAPRDATQAVTHVYALGQEIPSTDDVLNVNHERIKATSVRGDLLGADPPWPRLAHVLDLPDIKTISVLQEHADGWAAKYGGAATDEIALHVDPNHATWAWGRWDLGDECWVNIPAGNSRWWPDGLSAVRRIMAHHWEVSGETERLDVITEGDIDVLISAPPIVTPPDTPPVVVPPEPPPSPGPTSDGYMEFSGVSGNYVACSDDASDPTGDTTVIVDFAPADYTPGALMAIVGKYFSTTNQRSWELRLETSGKLSWQWSSNGTAVTPTGGGIATSTSAALASLGNFARIRVAVAHDVVNGTSNVVRFSYSTDSGASWLPLGTVTGSDTATTYTTAIFNSTTPIAVGANNAGTLRPFTGRVYDISVRTGLSGTDTPGGTEVAGIRAASIPADNNTTGAGQTFSSAGRTWTVNRSGATGSDTLLVPGGSTSGEPTPTLGSFFPIGIKDQPSDTVTINQWLLCGINTFVGIPSGTTVDAWSDGIEVDGRVYQIRAPRPVPADDIVSGAPIQGLLAWKHGDKPDLISAQIGSETLQADYATWNAVTGHPPVYLMVTGRMDSHDAQTFVEGDTNTYGEIWYREYFDAADWIAEDRQPVNQDAGLTAGGVSLIGAAVDRLEDWSGGGKPKFAYIECSDSNTSDVNPGPTVDQMRGEIWTAIIHGARGIVYIPQRLLPGFISDNSTPALRAEMTTQNSRITGLQAVLQNPINPTGFSASVPFPMEVGWRNTSTHRYFIVLNLSGATRTNQVISLSGAGGATTAEVYGESRDVAITNNQMADTFGPYACHIYKVAIVAAPPPNTGGTTINVSSTAAGAIATAIASANPGDTVLIANGTYPPIVTSKVSSGVGVTVQGASKTGVIINGGIITTGAQYITFTTMTVSGTVSGGANLKAGIFLTGSSSHHQTFNNMVSKPTSGSGADSMGCMSIRLGAHHITVTNCDLDATLTNGGQSRGLLIYGDGGNTVETNYCHDIVIGTPGNGNTIREADADCCFMYGMYNVRVEGNTIGPTRLNTDHNDHIQLLRGWHDITITGNTFTGQCDQSIQVNGKNDQLPLVAYNLTVTNNTLFHVTGNGLSLGGCQSGLFDGNDFSDNGYGGGTGYGLVLWSGVLETGFQGAPAGSRMEQNRNCRITNNLFADKFRNSGDVTANGVNGNICTGNDIVI
jgi:hypothetical protein